MLGCTERRNITRNYFKALFGIILALVIGTIPLWVKAEYNGTEVVFIMVAMFLLLTLFNNKNLYNPNKSITFAMSKKKGNNLIN